MNGSELITAWDMYWITRMDAIVLVAALTALISGAILVYSIGFRMCEVPEGALAPRRVVLAQRISLPTFIVAVIASVLVPRTTQMAAILVVPVVANNGDVQEIGGDLVELAKDWLKQQRKELEKK